MPLKSSLSSAVLAALQNASTPRRDEGGAAPLPSPATPVAGPVTGPLLGATGGRDDAIKTSVPDGSHIIPADVVSALGDGNSVAGAKKLSKMFPGNGPGIKGAAAAMPKAPSAMKLSMAKISPMRHMPSVSQPHMPRGITSSKFHRMPHMPGMPKGLADGGNAGSVRVDLSDGEFSVPPAWVEHIGEGDAERGHNALDAWMMNVRSEDIERRKRLPGPVKS